MPDNQLEKTEVDLDRQEQENKNQMEDSLDNSVLQNISTVESAQTVNELAELPPGLLTSEFTVENETSMWAKTEVPSELRTAFLSEIEGIVQHTKELVMLL